MSTILSARDLLELVRQREDEERAETENVVSSTTLGRRVYPGNTRRREVIAAARQASMERTAPRRGPRNTQLLEAVRPSTPAATQRQAVAQEARARRPTTDVPPPPARPAARDAPSRPSQQPPSPVAPSGAAVAKPAPQAELPATAPARPGAAVWSGLGSGPVRRATIPLPIQRPQAPIDRGQPDPAMLDELEEYVRDDARTLELTLPARPSSVAPPPPQAGGRSARLELRAPQVRAPQDDAPAARPVSRSLSPFPGQQRKVAAWGRPAERDPASNPPPASPQAIRAQPKLDPPASGPTDPISSGEVPRSGSSVADMFSWVTQKPEPVEAPEPRTRSVVADEPIALSSDETLVLIHFDTSVPLEAVAERTGLSEWRVTRIVDKLRAQGVLDEDPPPEPAPPPARAKPDDARRDPRAQRDADRESDARMQRAQAASERQASAEANGPSSAPLSPTDDIPLAKVVSRPPPARRDTRVDDEQSPLSGPATLLDMPAATGGPDAMPPSGPAPLESAIPPTEPDPSMVAMLAAMSASERADAERLRVDAGKDATTPEEAPPESVAAPEDDAPSTDDDNKPVPEKTVANYLARFETVLSHMSSDERAKLASTASGDDLFALCFDKDPAVIRSLWENINITHEHARFAAFHHRTTLGLELIAHRAEFLRDQQIQRRMIRNPLVSETLLRKMLLTKRLLEIYKVSLDREAAERTRTSARGLLRNKFATTEPEDRLELIWNTEGRALIALSGLSIDSKTAALICARPVVSMMLVQSFSRFAATPPSVIAHFLKQQIVKRQMHLRNALLKHPNCPSDAKRAW